jgi:hypothetical protein
MAQIAPLTVTELPDGDMVRRIAWNRRGPGLQEPQTTVMKSAINWVNVRTPSGA